MHMHELKFFIVDNDEFYTTLLKRKLENLGYENICVFHESDLALEKLGEKPDVVLLEQGLDNLADNEVLKKIKRIDPNMYVVMLSTEDELYAKDEALKQGAFATVEKGPKEQHDLQIVLKRIIEVRELLQKSKSGFTNRLMTIF